jgi:hypothetical protein
MCVGHLSDLSIDAPNMASVSFRNNYRNSHFIVADIEIVAGRPHSTPHGEEARSAV